jgi:radical SAM superfamily enzyme YgiQ (UPF0313 family)
METDMSSSRVFLGDLSYRTGGTPFPLGVGYMTAMTQQHYPNEFGTRIFINPLELERAIKNDPPAIVALANYSWNRNINGQFIKFIKRVSPSTITVLGGPCFARSDPEWKSEFFKNNPGLDFYIAGEGEWKWIEFLRQSLAHSFKSESMKEHMPVDVFFAIGEEVRQGQIDLGIDVRKQTLDKIPSPYLNGHLDPFFEIDGMVPMVETVRGCPYECTFCCWGDPSLSRLTPFSEERVREEINYIAERTKSERLVMADGNFGILKRDLTIAEHLRETSDKTGWPKSVFLYFAKNSNDRVVNIAKVLGHLIKVSLARQTMDDSVLKNIKRANIDEETFCRIQEQLKQHNIESMVEFIYPLPGETRQSFTQGLDRLFSKIDLLNSEVRFYPTELLPGSEMASKADRERFGLRSAWRRLSGLNAKFDEVSSCEYQEIVIGTDTFSLQDFFYVRKLHFLICLFATYKIYHRVVELYNEQSGGRTFIAFIERIINELESGHGPLRALSDEINESIRSELLPPSDYLTDDKYREYQTGEAKRINIYYILELLYGKKGEYRREFANLIKEVFREQFPHISTAAVKAALDSTENNIVDFLAIEQRLVAGTLPETLREIPHDGFVVEEFAKHYDGDLIRTLDKIYYTTYPAYLGRVVMVDSKFSSSEPAIADRPS